MKKQLIESIKKHEGLSLTAYKCIQGKLTIGYGHYLEDDVITQEVAEQMLLDDLSIIEKRIKFILPFFTDLPSHVQNVILEMAFQLGTHGFSKFKKTIEYIKQGSFTAASIEMLNSKWAKQTPNRAKTLSNLMRGGN